MHFICRGSYAPVTELLTVSGFLISNFAFIILSDLSADLFHQISFEFNSLLFVGYSDIVGWS